MKQTSISSVFYTPGQVPTDADEFQRFFSSELLKISSALNALTAGHLDMTTVAPTKPREGDLRFADGNNWNPGSGKGAYIYYTAAWHFLG